MQPFHPRRGGPYGHSPHYRSIGSSSGRNQDIENRTLTVAIERLCFYRNTTEIARKLCNLIKNNPQSTVNINAINSCISAKQLYTCCLQHPHSIRLPLIKLQPELHSVILRLFG